MDISKKPLNGEKTHPLSNHAREVLVSLADEPIPYSQINAGVINRLMLDEYVECITLPSPFKTHKGQKIRHIAITATGRGFLAESS